MSNDQGYIVINSNEMLKDFKQNTSYLLYFSSETCNVCHSVFPKLLDMLKGIDFPIGKIDVNKNLEIAGQNIVFAIPTILIFNENTEILRESRFIDFAKIERIIDQLKGGEV